MVYDLDEFEINVFVTRKCNLDCSHCYIDRERRRDDDYIKVERLGEILDEMEAFFKVNNFKVINIGLYGGEITQMPNEYLEEVVDKIEEKIKKYSPKTEVNFKVSTNLIAKNFEDYLKLLDKVDIIGISYDIEVNRFNAYNQKIWEENLKKLQSLNKRVTLNFTITNKVMGHEEHFIEIIKKYNINSIHLGYYVPSGKNIQNDLRPTHKQHSDFCKNMINLIMQEGMSDMDVSPIDGMASALSDGSFDGGVICEIFNSINLDTNGLVTLCIGASGNDTFPNQVIGNTNEESINNILKSKKYYKELLSVLNPNEICQSCEYQPICKQGCKILSEYGMEDGECWGYKSLWDHVKSNLTKLTRKEK